MTPHRKSKTLIKKNPYEADDTAVRGAASSGVTVRRGGS
jgi:hypothetical protein